MRARSLSLLIVSVAFVGCDDDHHGYGYDDNEIVFGVEQRVQKKADGTGDEVAVTGGYEFLHLAHRGGYHAAVFRGSGGGGVDEPTCYFESLGDRLGKPTVESGAATFAGGNLTSAGLQILANQSDTVLTGVPGWRDGDLLTFEVSGFAMPRIPSVTMNTPRAALTITAIAPPLPSGTETRVIKSTDSVGISWAPVSERPRSHVMLTLETEPASDTDRGAQVRCFSDEDAGSAIIPAQWVARLFSTVPADKPIQGRLGIASHRQVSIHERGGWLVYVVATTLHEEHAFTGERP